MDIPECRKYKEAYEKCYKEKISPNLSQFIFSLDASHACDLPFDVSQHLRLSSLILCSPLIL